MSEPDMIERVARAMHRTGELAPFDMPFIREQYMGMARAAIEAMREITGRPLNALQDQLGLWVQEKGTDADVWWAVIDAALSPTPPETKEMNDGRLAAD